MKKIAVYWKDINYYDDGKLHKPSLAYTEGTLFFESKKYIYIKYPTTIIADRHGSYHHPLIKPKYYYIPKSLITSIEYYEK